MYTFCRLVIYKLCEEGFKINIKIRNNTLIHLLLSKILLLRELQSYSLQVSKHLICLVDVRGVERGELKNVTNDV